MYIKNDYLATFKLVKYYQEQCQGAALLLGVIQKILKDFVSIHFLMTKNCAKNRLELLSSREATGNLKAPLSIPCYVQSISSPIASCQRDYII